MKIESHLSATITTETYQLSMNGKLFTFIEYFNDKGKVIDCNLRDVDGEEISDPYLLEQVQDFIDMGQFVAAEAAEEKRRDEKNGLYPDKVDVAN